jgi:hypothetical protein
MSAAPKKYVFVNGVMKLNPAFAATQTHSSPQTPQKIAPLAVVSCPADLMVANEIQIENGITSEISMPISSINAIGMMQDQGYLANYVIAPERNLFEELCEYFVMYEVPIGLISKLFALQSYRLNFMVDDSGR